LTDHRGTFSKLFHSNTFKDHLQQAGIDFVIHEVLHSTSAKKVLRGLHFQSAPQSTAKLVACLSGEVFDAVVDLRPKSPTYLKTFTTRLSGNGNTMIFIPEGLAHGFYAYEDNSTILYMTSGVFSPKHDAGIHWNSAGIEWPDPNPIISDRDQNLVPLKEFENPF
jgi:dTDP-4-dehydrorhamnose 3,5-epimerase